MKIALGIFFIIAAFIWFWDIVRIITGTYEFNPFMVGLAFFITGIYLIEGAFKLFNEDK